MTLLVPSDRSEFSSFPKLYADEIAPMLASREELRKGALKKGFCFGGLIAAIMFGLTFVVPEPMKFFIGVLGFMGAFGTFTMHVSKARSAITQELIGKIADQMDFKYRHKMNRPDYFEAFNKLKFFNAFNREHWEDEVRGSHAGQSFILCEGDLKYRTSGKNQSTRTIFHGQLLVIDYSKVFQGVTVLRRDAGMMNKFRKPGKEFNRVALASPEFEKAYEAWSTDQVEARELLDPVVLERFQELERLFAGKGLQAAFVDGKMLVALQTGDRMNMGSMFKPLEGKERVETILKEFDVIFDLIDVAIKQIDGQLHGRFSVDAVKYSRPA